MEIRIKGCKLRYISPEGIVLEELNNAIFKVGTAAYANSTRLYLSQKTNRGTILIPKAYEKNTVPYTHTSGEISSGGNTVAVDTDAISNYSAIYIPKTAKSITLSMTNNEYYYGLTLWGKNSGFISDSGWKLGGTPISVNIETYNEGLWVFSTIKKGEEGTDTVPQISIQDLGWSADVQF